MDNFYQHFPFSLGSLFKHHEWKEHTSKKGFSYRDGVMSAVKLTPWPNRERDLNKYLRFPLDASRKRWYRKGWPGQAGSGATARTEPSRPADCASSDWKETFCVVMPILQHSWVPKQPKAEKCSERNQVLHEVFTTSFRPGDTEENLRASFSYPSVVSMFWFYF